MFKSNYQVKIERKSPHSFMKLLPL